MRSILLVLSLVFLFACKSKPEEERKKENKSTDTTTNYLLVENSISKLVTANHKSLTGIKEDLISFKNYLSKLNNDSLTSIPFALDYIKTCISPGAIDRDSIFALFTGKFDAVINKLNDSLETYSYLIDQVVMTPDRKSFEDNLEFCGAQVLSTEGTHYLDVIPDYFYNNFKDRVSDGVKEYLNIRKDELKEGFTEDAGLLISFEDLYKRVKRWENFINKYPGIIYTERASLYYETYLETLMTGMDNSRIFDFDSNTLTPGVKALYENIIKKGPESPTTKIISSYYNFLARHDFKENDSIQLFLKMKNLSTMLAVQPNTR